MAQQLGKNRSQGRNENLNRSLNDRDRKQSDEGNQPSQDRNPSLAKQAGRNADKTSRSENAEKFGAQNGVGGDVNPERAGRGAGSAGRQAG